MFSPDLCYCDAVGLAVYDLIRKRFPQATVFLAGDDTLLNRRGLKIFGTGMHRDPMLSSRGFTVTNEELKRLEQELPNCIINR